MEDQIKDLQAQITRLRLLLENVISVNNLYRG